MSRVLLFVTDQFIGTWGVALSVPVLLASTYNLIRLVGWTYANRHFYPLLTENPYFPVQITLGLTLGWLLGSCVRRRSMLWVWVLPFLILCYALIATPTISPLLPSMMLQAGVGQSRVSHYLGWGCQPKYRCIDQIVITMPFYIGAAFSIGASLARKMHKRSLAPSDGERAVLLTVGLVFLLATFTDVLVSSQGGWEWAFLVADDVPAAMGAYLVLVAFKVRHMVPVA